METVSIVTRDLNGYRMWHYLTWDRVCTYIKERELDNTCDEILLIMVNNTCVYSGITGTALNWEDVVGFFA